MRKKLLSAGFQSPNYTQVPNDFFPLIPEMEDAELRVTLVMIRETFGFHREHFRMGINKLAEAAGLSRNGAKSGAEEAEQRGTFRRVNPDAQGSAEWELVIDHPIVEGWSASDQAPNDQEGDQPVTTTWSIGDQQLGIKERVKKESNKATTTTAPSNVFALYESNIGPLTPVIADALKDAEKTYSPQWVASAVQEAAKMNARNMKYIEGILRGYKERGGPDIGRTPVKETVPASRKGKPTESNDDIVRRIAQNAANNRR